MTILTKKTNQLHLNKIILIVISDGTLSDLMCRYSLFSVWTRIFTGQICTSLPCNRNTSWLKRSNITYVNQKKENTKGFLSFDNQFSIFIIIGTGLWAVCNTCTNGHMATPMI